MSSDPLSSVTFRCRPCAWTFDAEPARIEEEPEIEQHPWSYYAPCPHCGEECAELAQHRNLRLALGKHKGPANPYWLDGKRTMTAEQKARNRFNGMKHGHAAKVATYFPAKPGSQWCGGCDVDIDYCRAQPACIRNAQLILRHQIAFETKDPSLLRELRAELHGQIQVMINMMMLDIFRSGVSIEKPEYYFDASGKMCFIYDENGKPVTIPIANPLIKHLTDLIQKMGMSLEDLGMTEKQQVEETQLRGYLDTQRVNQDSLLEHQERQSKALELLSEQFARSRERLKRDPVLLEFSQEEG